MNTAGLDALSLPHDYGLTLSSPSWVIRLIEENAPKLDLISYTTGGYGIRWGAPQIQGNGLRAQDFVAYRRVRDAEL